MNFERRPKLLFVVGPTATGKSDLAVEIAAHVKPAPEIIGADSIQFFQNLEIGSAKPGPELLGRVRHHLVGHVPLAEKYTAGDFRRDSLKVISDGAARGIDRFLLVGGSGFYVQALDKGMYPVSRANEDLRRELEIEAGTAEGYQNLLKELSRRDPEAGLRISPNDRYRVLRAIEILRTHPRGENLKAIISSFAENQEPKPFDVAKLGLTVNREELKNRIEARTARMLERGLVAEVEALRAAGAGDAPALQSVGYREVQQMLDGKLSESGLCAAIVTSTMQLAKKQMTWFKRDRDIRWFDCKSQWSDAVAFGSEALNS